jgi:hypothetical protein
MPKRWRLTGPSGRPPPSGAPPSWTATPRMLSASASAFGPRGWCGSGHEPVGRSDIVHTAECAKRVPTRLLHGVGALTRVVAGRRVGRRWLIGVRAWRDVWSGGGAGFENPLQTRKATVGNVGGEGGAAPAARFACPGVRRSEHSGTSIGSRPARVAVFMRRIDTGAGEDRSRDRAGAVMGLAVGILVSVTTDVPLAPEAGLVLGALVDWLSRRKGA